MKQLTQKLNNGDMQVLDVPVPLLADKSVLVRNHYSLISVGTEGATVRAARKGMIGKAKERPDQVRQVLESLKRIGPVQTYRAVSNRLDAYSPLGYSCAGEVIAVGADVESFHVGDLVACGGIDANHAEAVSVPVNLCVRLRPDANLRAACYNTLGAIALQGIRQADLRMGESCCVIGLGLLGQLTAKLLDAGGIRAFGVDIDQNVVERANTHLESECWARDSHGLVDQILQKTDGYGVDAVIVTAATNSLDPINLAGRVARKKGRVVVVGDVPTGFQREPDYYRKELELRMSCSYGPGRYDPEYEVHGRDYPLAYVRWTEKRNMEAFQDLVYTRRVELDSLTTHEIAFEESLDAYQLVVDKSERALGIVLKYDPKREFERTAIDIREIEPSLKPGLGFIGVGSYAQSGLLPFLPDAETVVRRSVMSRRGTSSRRVAERFGFETCTSEIGDLLRPEVSVWCIATRHDSHASYVTMGLESNKHIFVEKPLALDLDELSVVECAHEAAPDRLVMVGFNRRFSPLTTEIRSHLSSAPMSMVYRVNAGPIPGDSWIHDPSVGGGRIIGEACHFIDYLTFLCQSLPVSVNASAMTDPANLGDTISIQLKFANGSIGTLHYHANGAPTVPKESIEVNQCGATFIVDDFRRAIVHKSGKRSHKRLVGQDKGQKSMVREFFQCVCSGGKPPIPFDEIVATTKATFAAVESIRTGDKIEL